MTAIPRYTSSYPLQTQFIKNADASGDHIFSQLKRSNNVCLYRRDKINDGKCAGFEVIVTKTIKAGQPLPGGNVVEKDYENYPGKSIWGKFGWSFPLQSLAENRFNKLVNNGEIVVPVVKIENKQVSVAVATVETNNNDKVENDNKPTTPYIIPAQEFSQGDFAIANGLALMGKVWGVLDIMKKNGVIKESRRVALNGGKGKPTCLFVKV
jgi:hypothetical protein